VRRPRRGQPLAAVLAAALVAGSAGLLGACTGHSTPAAAGSSSAAPDAAAILATAKKTLDAASAMHFTLSSDNSPKGASALVGGEGDIARPDRFSGSLDVLVAGQKLRVKVVSVGRTVSAQLFSSSWAKVNPAQFGLHDPGTFMAPQGGLGDLLSTATNPRVTGEKRRGTEVLRTVAAEVPGSTVARVLTTKDASRSVPAVFGVDRATGQLREATLTGPFFDASTVSTYTVVLEKYGEQVDIRAPNG
jgi:LppX_LprAFG lipoprotein